MRRRDFLATTGIAVSAVPLLASCGASADQDEPQTRGSGGFWEDVRAEFMLDPEVIHMSALLVSTHPRPVQEAIDAYRRELNRNPATYVERENDRRKEAVRDAAAAYLGGSARNVALTDSTTMGIAVVYHGIPIRSNQEILTTQNDYYATHETLRQVSERTGCGVRRIALYDSIDDVTAGAVAARIGESIRPSTRILALTWVHSNTGLKLPIRDIASIVSDANAGRDAEDRIYLCVDGVHALGVENETADELGCDFLMAGCHKWLFGPRGTGIVWGRGSAWSELRPTVPSFMDSASWTAWVNDEAPPEPTTAARMSPGGFKAFEHQWAMTDAFEFHRNIGKERIAERTHALAAQLKEGLRRIDGVQLRTPMSEELSSGIVSFDVDGLSPGAVVDRLARRDIIATVTPYATKHVRLTPCIYNAPEEIDAGLDALRRIA